ncbi:hypothetical protein ES708_32230 [subsurface metagenome]
MRQKKTISVLILGWTFLSLFSMISITEGVIVDDFDLTDFQVGDKVTYGYKTYYYQNPVTGFGWSSTRYERYVITEIYEVNSRLNIRADFWDRSSLNDLEMGDPDEADKLIGRLGIYTHIGDHIIPKNTKLKDYQNEYLSVIISQINNPAITCKIQSYAKGQGLYIKNMNGLKKIGEHKILYATTGILLKESYEISLGTTSDFTAEKEIIPSLSTIDGADETYNEVIIIPWVLFFIIGVPSVILSVVILKKMSKRRVIKVLNRDLISKSTPIKIEFCM